MLLKKVRIKILKKISLLAIILVINSCTKQQDKEENPTVFVFPVIAAEVPHITTAVGQVVPRENVQIIARVEGFLIKRLFKPGELRN